jgi:hypothetical protein
MSFNILTIPEFGKELKRLSKKYGSLKKEYADLIAELQQNPHMGIVLGGNVFKIRLAIASKRERQKWRCPGNYLHHYSQWLRVSQL